MNSISTKAALREQALLNRHQVTADEIRTFARHFAEVGTAFAVEQGAKIASAYWAFKHEASTFRLLDKLAKKNIATALPVMQGRGAPLLFRLWKQGDPLAESQWGIREPAEGDEVFPDLLFVPLLAFDRSGNRLGYGAGFYDRTLARLRSMQKIITVGLAYSLQEVPQVPSESYDQRLDYVLTEREWIVCT